MELCCPKTLKTFLVFWEIKFLKNFLCFRGKFPSSEKISYILGNGTFRPKKAK